MIIIQARILCLITLLLAAWARVAAMEIGAVAVIMLLVCRSAIINAGRVMWPGH